MKNLLSLDLLPNLMNLEVIEVDHCNQMEEIIAIVDEEEGKMVEDSSNHYVVINLPNSRSEAKNIREVEEIRGEKWGVCF